ncbi:MAG: hypothetical protein BWK76_07600 [Desulfobulbaceae bacterium A2]|nr:MAG: hypothetical protein BWK76_07600 [Desulfobulbaceae bacterium A2]
MRAPARAISGPFLSALAALVLLVAALLCYLPYREVRVRTLAACNAEQLLLARQAALGLEEYFWALTEMLSHLAGHPETLRADSGGLRQTAEQLLARSGEIKGVTRVDAQGRIVATYPAYPELIGASVADQSHNRRLMTEMKPQVSDVFQSLQGYQAVVLAVPVFDGTAYAGSFSVLLSFAELSGKYLDGVSLGEGSYAWMIDGRGVELYCPVPGHVGRNVRETSADFPLVLAMAEAMQRGEQGSTVYTYDRVRDQRTESIKKFASYHPVRLPGTIWSIVVSSPEQLILAPVTSFLHRWLLLTLLCTLGVSGLALLWLQGRAQLTRERLRGLAETRLAESRQLLAEVLENSHIPIVMVRFDGVIEYINENCRQTYGYTVEELPTIDVWFAQAYPEPELRQQIQQQWEARLQQARDHGRNLPSQLRRVHLRDGTVRDIEFSYSIVHERFIITPVDRTDSLRLDQERQEMQRRQSRTRKMEALGLLAGGVAHDLNNILTGVTSIPELLLLDLPPDSPWRPSVVTIREAGLRAAAVVADLLTVARGVASRKEIADLNGLVQEYFASSEQRQLAASHPGVRFCCEPDAAPCPLLCSRVHVRKALMNLVHNGAEAISGHGRVTVSTRREHLAQPLRGYQEIAAGDYVVLRVQDSGSGIAEAALERIFEPFFSSKAMGRSGTGLGLAIVWNTIQDHEGGINVSSGEEGSVFSLYFPVAEGRVPAGDRGSQAREFCRGAGQSVLVVDDEEPVRAVTRQMVERLGYRPLTAASGEEAVELVRRETVDVLLLDMIMPAGMNGRETLAAVRRVRPDVPCLLVSGFAASEDVRQALASERCLFLGKPHTLEDLGRALQRLLR